MSLYFGFAIYLVLWWLTLFMVLPWGIRRVDENELEPGEDPGAPSNPRLLIKFTATTILSGIFFALFYLVFESGWISFR